MRLSMGCLRCLLITVSLALTTIVSSGQAGSNSPVCEGGTISLSVGTAGTSYSWTGPNNFTSASRNPTIVSANSGHSGTYSVTVTSSTGSTTYSTDVVVNDNPDQPAVAPLQNACLGSKFTLFASNYDPVVDYYWEKGTFSSALDSLYFANVTAAIQGNYTVVAILEGCTSTVATFTLKVNSPPATPTISTPKNVCQGSALVLKTSNGAGMNYNWTGPNEYNSTTPISTIQPTASTDAGEYTVQFTDPNTGCKSTVSKIQIIVLNAPPTPTVQGDTMLCDGDTLSLTGASTLTNPTYSWSGPAGTQTTKKYYVYPINTSFSGSYSLMVNDGTCNSVPRTVLVTIGQKPAQPSIITSKTLYCEGDTINMQTNFPSSSGYRWGGPSNFTGSTAVVERQNIVMKDSGDYYVQTLENGCYSDSAFIFISIKPTPEVPALLSNGPVCDQTEISLTAATYENGVTYEWEAPNGTTYPDSVKIAVSNLSDEGTYKLRASTNGCTSLPKNIYLKIKKLIKPYFGPYMPDSVCQGYDFSFLVSDFEQATYLWKKGNVAIGFDKLLPFIDVTPQDSGLYILVATNTCDTASDTVNLKVLPSPDVRIIGDSFICYFETKELIATPGYSKYEWYSSGVVFDTLSTIKIDSAGSFKLVTENMYQCTTDTYFKVDLICQPEVYIPNSFTPNNDGLNDHFGVVTHNIHEFHIEIFNRLGRKVFQSDDPYAQWDGTFDNHKLDGGQYVYSYKYKTVTPHQIYEGLKSGSFFMFR